MSNFLGSVHQGALTFDVERINELIIPKGLLLIVDKSDDYSERKVYFLEDEYGNYEELIPTKSFWLKYAEDLKVIKAMDEVYAS